MTKDTPEPLSRAAREAHYRALLAEHVDSGQSLVRFAKDREIAYSTLLYWRRRLATPTGSRLVPVKVVDLAPTPPDAPFELQLAGGRVLRIPSQCSPAALARLLEVIDRPC